MSLRSAKNRRRALERTVRPADATRVGRSYGKLVLKGVAGLLVAGGMARGAKATADWATHSPRFALENVRFVGISRATESELVRMGGLANGQNLWTLDAADVARAMTTHPWVRRVDITRHFPHSVAVRVVEHIPAAMVVLQDLYLLDEQGEPFKRITAADTVDLPLVTGLGRDAYMRDPAKTVEKFRTALGLARAYEASDAAHGEKLSEVRVERDGAVLVTGLGQEVRLGDGATDEKLVRLGRVRGELSRRGLLARTIRLDNRTRPGWVAVELDSAGSQDGSKKR